MSIITSLVLPCIEISYTPEYIANAFWNQRIAQVSNITLLLLFILPILFVTSVVRFLLVQYQLQLQTVLHYFFLCFFFSLQEPIL